MWHRHLMKQPLKSHGYTSITRQNHKALIVDRYKVEELEKGLINTGGYALGSFSKGKAVFNYMDGGSRGSVIDIKIVDHNLPEDTVESYEVQALFQI